MYTHINTKMYLYLLILQFIMSWIAIFEQNVLEHFLTTPQNICWIFQTCPPSLSCLLTDTAASLHRRLTLHRKVTSYIPVVPSFISQFTNLISWRENNILSIPQKYYKNVVNILCNMYSIVLYLIIIAMQANVITCLVIVLEKYYPYHS